MANRSNVISSPLSIWSLLLLLAEGSSGRTYDQLRSVLRLPADLSKIRMVYKYVHGAFAQNNTAIELKTKQVLFCDINRPIDIDFQDKLENTYGDDYYPVDFLDKYNTVNQINSYVRDKVNGKIDRIIESNDLGDAHMLLISAVFFQGRWKVSLFIYTNHKMIRVFDIYDDHVFKEPFNIKDTRDQPFYNENGIKIANVPTMFRKGKII